MMRLLRWATLLVLLLLVSGIAMSYPILRDRFSLTPAAATSVAISPADKSDAIATASLTATVLAEPAVDATPTLIVTPENPPPAVIIETPTPTILAAGVTTESLQFTATNTPAAVATTSLLPVIEATATPISSAQENESAIAITPQSTVTVESIQVANTPTIATVITAAVTPAITSTKPIGANILAGTIPTTTGVVTANVATVIVVTPGVPTPIPAPGQPAQVGEKGYEPPLQAPSIPTLGIIPIGPTITGTAIPIAAAGGTVTPIAVTSAEITPVVGVSPTLAISVAILPAATPTPNGPYANADSPLFSGPDKNSAAVGGVRVGEQVTIVGLYTEGTWYLLVNGLWLPGAIVSNVPFAVPLVFPTITPVPSLTPTVTTTPQPTATPIGSPTPAPTATSLDQSVCDCSGDNLDCLGSVFSSQAQAQQCFEYCFRQTGEDVHHLDPNGNGVACENLP